MKGFLVLFLISGSLAVSAQTKEVEQRDMTWLAYFNQTRLSNHSGLWLDAHLRLNDGFVNEVHAAIARLGYVYFLSDKARITLGYAYQQQPGHEGRANVLEHRPWQQIQWFEKKSWFTMMQWLRAEQRYRNVNDAEGYRFLSHRLRYNVSLTIPLTRKELTAKTPFLFANNEVFINLGKNIVNNYFDQNRFCIAMGYQFTSHVNAHFGYMYVFQQLPAGNRYVSTDALRLFIFHSLDLRKRNDE